MGKFLDRAKEIQEKLIDYRRHLHRYPEVGMDLPETTKYVMKVLKDNGLKPEEIVPSGISVLIEGKKPGKTILLRADMDALPMEEKNDLDFASQNPGKMHACGHDIHTSMMIGAAILLNERKDDLSGNVKIMFQPGEEIFQGAKEMIKAGILENPNVDAALDMHVDSMSPLGTLNYKKGPFTTSGDNFTITLKGEGVHGSEPHNGKDPINAAAHIIIGLQALQAREIDPGEHLAMSICSVEAGTTHNIVPGEAILRGTMRTYNSEVRDYMLKRIPQVVEYTGKTFGIESDFEVVMGTPSIVNDPEMVDEIKSYLEDFGMEFDMDPTLSLLASDDFGYIASRVPSLMFSIGCKPEGVDNNYLHNPGVVFDEDVIPIGAAIFAHSAFNWLENKK